MLSKSTHTHTRTIRLLASQAGVRRSAGTTLRARRAFRPPPPALSRRGHQPLNLCHAAALSLHHRAANIGDAAKADGGEEEVDGGNAERGDGPQEELANGKVAYPGGGGGAARWAGWAEGAERRENKQSVGVGGGSRMALDCPPTQTISPSLACTLAHQCVTMASETARPRMCAGVISGTRSPGTGPAPTANARM